MAVIRAVKTLFGTVLPILVLACLLRLTGAQEEASSEEEDLFTPPCAVKEVCNRKVVQ